MSSSTFPAHPTLFGRSDRAFSRLVAVVVLPLSPRPVAVSSAKANAARLLTLSAWFAESRLGSLGCSPERKAWPAEVAGICLPAVHLGPKCLSTAELLPSCCAVYPIITSRPGRSLAFSSLLLFIPFRFLQSLLSCFDANASLGCWTGCQPQEFAWAD
jgi:hypothetical protein